MKRKPRFKIDVGTRGWEDKLMLYRRHRWFFWKSVGIFNTRSEARQRLREIEMLPEYF